MPQPQTDLLTLQPGETQLIGQQIKVLTLEHLTLKELRLMGLDHLRMLTRYTAGSNLLDMQYCGSFVFVPHLTWASLRTL